MLVKASVYFGSVCEMRESAAVAESAARWRGVDVASRLSNRWLVLGRSLTQRATSLSGPTDSGGMSAEPASPAPPPHRPRSSNYECQMLSHATVRRAVRTPLRRSS